VNQELEEEYKNIWLNLLPLSRLLPNSLVLRDYHADNLMWLPDRSHIKRVGVLDFQDALIGSQAYDIVSLLEDLRRDISDELANKMITHYLDSNSNISRKEFLVAYHILGAQRNCKILGFCARKAMRDNNPTYLRMLPRMWRYIEKDLRHPLLLPLKKWFDKAIPANIRSSKK
jgi:aminoglycoside/choline kinase family phosphotransferase